jgi:hypothetical protein
MADHPDYLRRKRSRVVSAPFDPLDIQIDNRPMLRQLFDGKLFCLIATLSCAVGCRMVPPPTQNPMPTQSLAMDPGALTSTLVVFLPGRGGSMNDFEREGLAKIMRSAGVRADAISADAHLGYYFERTITDRLMTDVIQPARARGYRRIVLVGLSLGGLGSLLSERDHPGAVDAIVLLSPYLGERAAFVQTITAAGGPAQWAVGRPARTGVVDEEVWTFLGLKSSALPPTWLLYGRGDRFAPGQHLLSTLLPPDHVILIEGGHNWKTWRKLWKIICERPDLFAAEKSR